MLLDVFSAIRISLQVTFLSCGFFERTPYSLDFEALFFLSASLQCCFYGMASDAKLRFASVSPIRLIFI